MLHAILLCWMSLLVGARAPCARNGEKIVQVLHLWLSPWCLGCALLQAASVIDTVLRCDVRDSQVQHQATSSAIVLSPA